MEQEIRELLAEALRNDPSIRERAGMCYGLAKRIKSGNDTNPRTLAAIVVIEKILMAKSG